MIVTVDLHTDGELVYISFPFGGGQYAIGPLDDFLGCHPSMGSQIIGEMKVRL
jgi:hypothetical protein